MVNPQITGIEGSKIYRTLALCAGNICECLDAAIQELLNNNAPHGSGAKGLKQHWAEQTGPGASAPGTDVWDRHQTDIQRQQRNLRDHLREHEANGCGGPGGGSPVPEDAWQWATRPLPTQGDWDANNATAYEGMTGSMAGDAVAVAGGVGLGYLLYRGVRMIPSLFPPAWPTIPANLAIP